MEGAELDMENQRGPSQRGRCGGGELLPPTPFRKAEFINPVFAKKRFFFRENCVSPRATDKCSVSCELGGQPPPPSQAPSL